MAVSQESDKGLLPLVQISNKFRGHNLSTETSLLEMAGHYGMSFAIVCLLKELSGQQNVFLRQLLFSCNLKSQLAGDTMYSLRHWIQPSL